MRFLIFASSKNNTLLTRGQAGLLAVALLAASVSVHAASLVVDWSGDHVSSSQNLQRNTYLSDAINIDGDVSANDYAGGILFSDYPTSTTDVMSPGTGYGGTSATFYGGAITVRQDNVTPPAPGEKLLEEAFVQNQGPNDSMHIHLSHAGETHDLHAALIWNYTDFLNGGSPFTFSPATQVLIGIGSSTTENLVGAQVRVLVRDSGGNYWVSNTAFTSPNANSSFTWNTWATETWATYTPSAAFAGEPAGSDLRFDQGTASFSASTADLDPIYGVGFLFEQDTFHNNINFHMERFYVGEGDPPPIPEPSTLGAGISAALLGLLARYRRRRLAVSAP